MKWLIACAIALSLSATAQTSIPTPIPVQLRSAKKVFVANMGPDSQAYGAVYQELQKWSNVEIVSRPKEAELAIEVGSRSDIGETYDGRSFAYLYLELTVVDVETGIPLWRETQSVNGNRTTKSIAHDIEVAASELVKHYRIAIGDLPAYATDSASSNDKKRIQKEAKSK